MVHFLLSNGVKLVADSIDIMLSLLVKKFFKDTMVLQFNCKTCENSSIKVISEHFHGSLLNKYMFDTQVCFVLLCSTINAVNEKHQHINVDHSHITYDNNCMEQFI